MAEAAARRPDLDAIERMLTSEDGWEYEHDAMCRDLVRYTRDLEAQRNAAVAVLREAKIDKLCPASGSHHFHAGMCLTCLRKVIVICGRLAEHLQ